MSSRRGAAVDEESVSLHNCGTSLHSTAADTAQHENPITAPLSPTSILLSSGRPKQRRCCGGVPWTRVREAFYATVIAVLCVLVLVLAIDRGQRYEQLPPYCLFAVGGGYMEGTAFPQEKRLASPECNKAIRAYLTEGQYETDVESVAEDALDVLKGLSSPNATYLLVFDIDETVLSNMAEFEHMRYGKKPYDAEWEHQWQRNASAPALEPMLRLYKSAFEMGLSVTFVTGRSETARNATEFNLKHSGFGEQCSVGRPRLEGNEPCYVQLDLRENGDKRPASVYKPERRGRLQEAGYTLLGNFGDQWSDLVGEFNAQANFKLPNPMYYLL
mmetsp:Transcript_3207/g.5843  ORF Transcript_3207/g.5843 Transcript_3207/m.5843 type:complete len:330 (-) Transcript_3207:202-1191(-)